MTKKRRTYEPRVFDGRLMLGGVGAASPMSPPPSFRTRNGYPAADACGGERAAALRIGPLASRACILERNTSQRVRISGRKRTGPRLRCRRSFCLS
jgi:hypothetical protein